MAAVTGRVVHQPDARHRCVTPRDHPGLGGGRHRQGPAAWPAGTVWACDWCGRTWVLRPNQLPPGWVNRNAWTPESRLARWWRRLTTPTA